MKKLLLPIFVLMAMLLSCSDDDNGVDLPVEINETFYGVLSLNSSAVLDDAKCGLDIVGDSAVITLYGLTFSPLMPVIDIVIPSLACTKNGSAYVISGKDVVPLVDGVEKDLYKMDSVEASFTDGVFKVSAIMRMGTIGFTNESSGTDEPNVEPANATSFKGELLSGDFSMKITVDVSLKDDASSTLDIVLNDVKFAEKMPVLLDIMLKEIPCTIDGDRIVFAAENVAPYILPQTKPFYEYMFANIQGSIIKNDSKTLQLSAKMADNLDTDVAGMEFVFDGKEFAE